MKDIDLPELVALRDTIRICLDRADAARLTDVALRLDAAYLAIDEAVVSAAGAAVPPPPPPTGQSPS